MEITKQRIEKDQGFIEKREFLRIEINSPVKFHAEKSDWQEGTGINLSGQGILVEASIRLSIGDKVTVHMKPNNEAQSLLEAEGVVVRCHEVDNDKYHIGVRFNTVK